MSRVGNNPINIPSGVEISMDKNHIKVSGSKGILEMEVNALIKIETEGNTLLVKRSKDDKNSKSLHGLYRALLNNMVLGVSEGFNKGLELVGVGYRASGGGNALTLSIGYSHPVQIEAPEGITFTVSDNTKLVVSGIDKHLVGQVAANIRKIRPPEVYKGKGIRYTGEYVRRKAGKAGKAATAAK